MTYPVVQFVSAPEPDADVRLDLNSDFGSMMCQVNADGLSFGAPSLMGEPGAVGSALSYRTLNLTARMEGPKAAALDVLTLMAREQLRATNWLHVKVSQFTPSRWFPLYKSPPQPLSLDEVDVGESPYSDAWTTTLQLTADPFVLLERVTLGPYTVTQSPDGDHSMRVVLPAIEGDAPTPLRVTVTSDGSAGDRAGWLIGSVSSTAAISDIVVDIGTGDGWTAVNAADSADADMFGGSCRVVTSSGVGTVLRTLPAVSNGRYRVLLRCQATSGTEEEYITLHARQDTVGTRTDPEEFDVDLGTVLLPLIGGEYEGWVDLCELAVPFASAVPVDVGLDSQPPRICVEVTAPSGRSISLDAIKLVPIDAPDLTTALLWTTYTGGQFAAGGYRGAWDGDTDAYWLTNPAGDAVVNSRVTHRGRFPFADPAAEQNTLLVIATSNGGDTAPAITSFGSEAEVTVSYQPRKLHL